MLRKYTVLALLRIQTYARKNTLIFCLFLLGAVLSSLSFLFFYGNSMADKRIWPKTLFHTARSPCMEIGIGRWRTCNPFGTLLPFS